MAIRDAQFWAGLVAEAETSGMPHTQIAAKHGVSAAALKYHVYKARKAGVKPAPRVLPVRIAEERRTFQVELGPARLSFAEGCEPSYVAAVLSAVGKTC